MAYTRLLAFGGIKRKGYIHEIIKNETSVELALRKGSTYKSESIESFQSFFPQPLFESHSLMSQTD